jgi:ABC-type lipoprotein release transport system permease subunit
MSGYMEELRKNIRGQESHLLVVGQIPYSITHITRLERLIQNVENVSATAPFAETLAMYKSSGFHPCQLKGIQPAQHAMVSSLGEYVLRPAELDRLLLDLGLDQTDQASESTQPARSERPTARTAIDKFLSSRSRDALKPEELEGFFKPDFRKKLLQDRNPAILGDLGGRIPPAILVGIHLLLDREMFLGEVATIVTIKHNSSEPVSKQFLVAGAFKTGDYDADSKALYVHVDALKNMLDLFDPKANSSLYSGVRVALKDLSLLEETREKLQRALVSSYPLLKVVTWEELRSNLLRAVLIEKFLIYFLLVLLMAFSACMVLLMLLLTVIEKTRDIGVLLALGATPGDIQRLFLANGLFLSIAGTLLGLTLGYLFCIFINPIHDWIYAQTGMRLFPAEIYHMDRVPITFKPLDLLLSITPPVLLGFVASLSPAVWASRRDPIKAIQYE